MSFTDFYYILFFAAVYAVLWVNKILFFGKNKSFTTINKAILLIGSYLFTAIADVRFCISLLAVTLIIYFISIKLPEVKNKRLLLAAGVTVILLQLGFFKYFNFFSDSLASLFGADPVFLDLIAPLGISFYSFSAVGYMVDIYREKYQPQKSFLDVALYISFFAKIVSGPLMKPNDFFSQLDENHSVSRENFEQGIQIVLVGLFKKMVLADRLSVFVNDVFSAPAAFDWVTVILAVLSYSLQIYFDFSGYSDIAIGFAKMIGFDIKKNFDLPYVSLNPTEFWKRWHISLSQWLQEYLYISMGGNRKGTVRTYLNLLLTMVIGGLWHGADMTFVVWGALNGFALIIHKLFKKLTGKIKIKSSLLSLIAATLSCVANFIFVNITWVFFRADSFGGAIEIFSQMQGKGGITQIYSWFFVAAFCAFVEILRALVNRKKNNGKIIFEYIILDLTKIRNLVILIVFMAFILLFAYFGNTAFIYGNF